MDRIETFRSDAAQCMKSNAWISDQFVFSEFCLLAQENTLKCNWTSLTTHKVCTITYIASEDYPENCFLQQQWEESGVQDSIISNRPLLQLLTSVGSELQLQDCHKMESEDGRVSSIPAGIAKSGDCSGSNSGSDLEYTDCESLMSSEEEEDDDDDTYDFDPIEYFEELSSLDRKKTGGSSILDLVHPLLAHDIQTFKDLLVPPEPLGHSEKNNNKERKDAGGSRKGGAATGEDRKVEVKKKKKGVPALSMRLLETLGEIDCDIHVPLDNMNMSPQLASAWKLHLDEPLVVRFTFNSTCYLNSPDPPKVDVFQPNKKECGIAVQMRNVMKLFVEDVWRKTDNDLLESHLRRSGSVPTNLSNASGVAVAVMEEMSTELKHLLEMGFGEMESRSALLITDNNLMEASVILATNASSNMDPGAGATPVDATAPSPAQTSPPWKGHRPLPPLPRKGSKGLKKLKRHLSSPVKPEGKRQDRVARSMSASYTEPNLTAASDKQWAFEVHTSLDVKEMPSLVDGFLVMLYKYIRQRVPRLNEFCVICDCPHVFQANGAMLMPSVCSRELCLFAFQTLGVMANATADIATGAEVVDLLITMAKTACFSPRQATIFTPYPNIVDPEETSKLALSDKSKDFRKVEELLKVLPSMSTLTGSTLVNLHRRLDQKDRLLYPLLSWIIYSNRSHIVKLPPEKQLKFMATPHQFLLLSSPPAQEKRFQELKAQYGSTFAFHGSGIENWHAIIRQGLIVASGTKFQMNGAAHGKGIYLSPQSNFSFGYSKMGHGVHNVKALTKRPSGQKGRFLTSSHLNCMALCEVIKSSELQKKSNEIWVVTSEAHVCTRFFFVYEDGQVGSDLVDMTVDKYRKMVENALASCFMAVVPDRDKSTENPTEKEDRTPSSTR